VLFPSANGPSSFMTQLFWEVGGGVLCDGFLVYRCPKYSPRSFCHTDYKWHYITGTLGNPKKPSAETLTEDVSLWFVNYITLCWQDLQVLSVYGTIAIIHIYIYTHAVELHLSRRWLSGLPIIWISLVLRVNLSRILQNNLPWNYQISYQVQYNVMASSTSNQA
jgi:hypothetical protein